MVPRVALLVALAACAPLAQAQAQRGVMAVSATVVNTCFFGLQARCHLPGTRLEVQVNAAPATAGAIPASRRIVHL